MTGSVLMLWLATFVGFLWVAAELETVPVHEAAFHRWWFFPVGLLAGTLGVGLVLFRRGRRRSAFVLGTLTMGGLVGLLVVCPYV